MIQFISKIRAKRDARLARIAKEREVAKGRRAAFSLAAMGIGAGASLIVPGVARASYSPAANAATATSTGIVRPPFWSEVTISPTGDISLNNATQYCPTGHTFGRLISGAPATLAAYYGSLSAAQAVFSFATSLTNYADRCVVQLALNIAETIGETVRLPPGNVYLDTTVSWNAHNASLAGWQSYELGTFLLCETCGTSPALAFHGGSPEIVNYRAVISSLTIVAFNSGIVPAPANTGGTAWTGYRTGSIALQISNAFFATACYNVAFWNFDEVYSFVTGDVYCLDFINCVHGSNNKGIVIDGVITNSFERMVWKGGSSSNNNYGFYINVPNGAGSVFIEDLSIDYNIVQHGYYDSLGSGNDSNIPLFIDRCHLETKDATSGTAARIFNNGDLCVSNCNVYENGANPVGFVQAGFYARTSVVNTVVPGIGNGLVPVVWQDPSGGPTPLIPRVTASGLHQRYAGNIQLVSCGSGVVMFSDSAQPLSQTAAFTLDLSCQARINSLSGTGFHITIPLDSTANHFIGAEIQLMVTDLGQWTLVPESGSVTIDVPYGRALWFGGATGTTVTLTKIAANTWSVIGGLAPYEDARTNIALASNAFTNTTYWTIGGVPVLTATAAYAPDGTLTAWSMADAVSVNTFEFSQTSSIPTGATVVISLSFKQGTGRWMSLGGSDGTNYWGATIDLQTGTVSQGTTSGGAAVFLAAWVEDQGNGWYRLSVSGNTGALSTGMICLVALNNTATPGNAGLHQIYTGTGLLNYICDFDMQVGTFPTSYIPSGTTAGVRPPA